MTTIADQVGYMAPQSAGSMNFVSLAPCHLLAPCRIAAGLHALLAPSRLGQGQHAVRIRARTRESGIEVPVYPTRSTTAYVLLCFAYV